MAMEDHAPVLRSPRGSLHAAVAHLGDAHDQYLPWKIAFRVQFQYDKFGLRFHPAQFPDTGNGVYTIRVLELNKNPTGAGPAQQYNASLRPGQEHLQLRPGLYLTHINDSHLLDVPCEQVISSLQTAPRPTTLRFVDVEAGVVTPHELRDALKLDPDPTPVLIDGGGGGRGGATFAAASPAKSAANGMAPLMAVSAVRKTSAVASAEPAIAAPASPANANNSGGHVYKIILLGTTGVGKSSVLAVGAHGDEAYVERRATTLEAEFGSFEIADPDMSTRNKIKARIWDTAGQERYRAITRSHYRRADGALLVYDVAERESFEKLGEWLKTLKETAGDSLKTIMVVENKIDQLPEAAAEKKKTATAGERPKDFVQQRDVQRFCKEHGMLFARTTAKCNAAAFKWEGQKVGEAFSSLLLHIHATTLARGLQHLAGVAGGADDAATVAGGTIELTASPVHSSGATSQSLSDCGSCGRSQ